MKKFLNFIIGKLFRIPKANLNNIYPPPTIECTPLDIKKFTYEQSIERGIFVPESIVKKELVRGLSEELIPYIHFETTEDIYTDSIRYRGVIRIAIDKESKNE